MVWVEDCQGTHTHESTAAPDWQLWWHTTKLAVLVAHESPSVPCTLCGLSTRERQSANPEEPTHVHNIQTNQQHRQTTKEEEDGKEKKESKEYLENKTIQSSSVVYIWSLCAWANGGVHHHDDKFKPAAKPSFATTIQQQHIYYYHPSYIERETVCVCVYSFLLFCFFLFFSYLCISSCSYQRRVLGHMWRLSPPPLQQQQQQRPSREWKRWRDKRERQTERHTHIDIV